MTMSRGPQQPAEGEPFQDPLENYEPRTYADPLEEALAERTVEEMPLRPFTTIAPEASVRRALSVLAGLEISCLLVAEEGHLLGVFSERDVLSRVALRYDQVKDRAVREVMTPDPVHVYSTDSVAAALCVMAVSGYRHVPVLDPDETLVGIASPQRITAFLQEHFERPPSS